MSSVAIILSGGKGVRLGSDIPKQYIEICGKSILEYTIAAFEQSDVDEIIIVAAQEYIKKCREIADYAGGSKVIAVICGGSERYFSVLNGLRYLFERANLAEGCDIPMITLIHDGARPFIRPAVINEIIRSVASGSAAIAAVPCTDTIKISDENGYITSTTERTKTWAAQTPQAFPTEEIYQAYEKIIGTEAANCSDKSTAFTGNCSDKSNASAGNSNVHLKGITDDAMVYQMAFPDRKVRLIPAGSENFKITTADDIVRAEGMIVAGNRNN